MHTPAAWKTSALEEVQLLAEFPHLPPSPFSLSKTIKSATKNAKEGIVKSSGRRRRSTTTRRRRRMRSRDEQERQEKKKKSNSAQQLRNRGMASYWPLVGPLDNTKAARVGKFLFKP